MQEKSKNRPYFIRLGIIFVICLALVAAFNEITFYFQKDSSDRAPQPVSILIPKGTAERVAAGEPEPSIPENLVFVAGDVLEVTNEDVTSHQLGPLWIPAGGTASLALDVPQKVQYSCTFQPSQFFEIDVREPTKWGDRIIGLTLAAPTVSALVFLYSLAAAPINPPEKKKPAQPAEVSGP